MSLASGARRVAKRVAADVLYRSGALGLYRARATKASAVVLLYHRIVDDPPELLDYSPTGIIVRREAFDAQMAYLRRHYRLVYLNDLVEQLASGHPLDDRLCAVTFDDGWRDNYTHALPILKKYQVPCTIFLSTNFIDGTPWFWEARLKYVLGHVAQRYLEQPRGSQSAGDIRTALGELGLAQMLGMPVAQLRLSLVALVNRLRSRPADERDRLMQALENLLQRIPVLHEPRRFLTWDEVGEMERGGVAFGAHTLSHVNLARCDAATADTEIRGSKARIEDRLATAKPLFAYPFGKATPEVRKLVADASFTAAVTTVPGLITAKADPYQLNRIDICENTAPTLSYFACRVLQFMRLY
jgi:peptidoglycan/xylan/chitin deacetylase (PgdA/CDA1 family)